jgi:hypothetical protein
MTLVRSMKSHKQAADIQTALRLKHDDAGKSTNRSFA